MKILRLTAVAMTVFALVAPLTIFADANPPPSLQLPDNPLPGGAGDILTIIGTVADWIYSALLFLAVVFILLAAFNYLTSSGSAEKVTKAHKMLIYALVAVAIALLAKGLVTVISSIVGNKIVLPQT